MSQQAGSPSAKTAAETELQGGALRLPPVLMQAITHIAPAAGVVVTIQFIASYAGLTSPIALIIAFLTTLTLGLSLTQLARHLPSAGAYYTYVSHPLHPRAGFLTRCVYFLYDPLHAAMPAAF